MHLAPSAITHNKKIALLHCCVLVGLALGLNILFFNFHKVSSFFAGTLLPHGEIAYNVWQHNSLKITPERSAYLTKQQALQDRIIQYYEVNHDCFAEPSGYRSVHDTVGYGVLLGLLWKITGSLSYRDAQILQILLFALLMILVYDCALILFHCHTTAFISALGLLAYLPLTFINVQAHRDIWAYYGIVTLVWILVRSVQLPPSPILLLGIGSFFAVCQWMRPPIFFSLALCAVTWMIFGYMRQESRRFLGIIAPLLVTNFLIFWCPFVTYNYHAYGRPLVSCSGVNLLEGIGEYPNKWGYVMSDSACAELATQYGEIYGTAASNAKLEELFWQAFREEPLFVIGTMIKRIPQLFYFKAVFTNSSGYIHSPFIKIFARIFDIVTSRHWLNTLFLILGWISLFNLLWRRQFFILSLFCAVMVSSWPHTLSSHVEPRYLITFYWVLIFPISFMATSYSHYLRSAGAPWLWSRQPRHTP